MACKENVMKLCTQKQEDCMFFTPVHAVGFEDIYLPDVDVKFVHNSNDNYMLFLLSGTITMTFGSYQNKVFEGGDMFFMPRNMNFQGVVVQPVHLALLKYNYVRLPCMEDRIRSLVKKKEVGTYAWDKVKIKDELRQAVKELIHYGESGLSCNHICIIKAQEIYLIFKHFYTDEERITAFFPYIGENPKFAEMVISNYMNVKTAEELAALLGYGIKTFRELFKSNFGETPYKWMQAQMAVQMKSQLMKKDIPLKQIMFEYKFTTTSHFTMFCRKHFGGTPLEVRNGLIVEDRSLI